MPSVRKFLTRLTVYNPDMKPKNTYIILNEKKKHIDKALGHVLRRQVMKKKATLFLLH